MTAVCCIARDIRKDKLQERLISESYQRLKAALGSAALSCGTGTFPRDVCSIPKSLRALLRMSPGELPQDARPCQHLAHADDARPGCPAAGASARRKRILRIRVPRPNAQMKSGNG